MQRKMGCPELVFEILNFEYNQLDEFLKENGENQASYEKNHFSKTIKGLDGIFSGNTIEALFSINNIDCLEKKSKLSSKFIILFIKSTENFAQMTTKKSTRGDFSKGSNHKISFKIRQKIDFYLFF